MPRIGTANDRQGDAHDLALVIEHGQPQRLELVDELGRASVQGQPCCVRARLKPGRDRGDNHRGSLGVTPGCIAVNDYRTCRESRGSEPRHTAAYRRNRDLRRSWPIGGGTSQTMVR